MAERLAVYETVQIPAELALELTNFILTKSVLQGISRFSDVLTPTSSLQLEEQTMLDINMPTDKIAGIFNEEMRKSNNAKNRPDRDQLVMIPHPDIDAMFLGYKVRLIPARPVASNVVMLPVDAAVSSGLSYYISLLVQDLGALIIWSDFKTKNPDFEPGALPVYIISEVI